MTAKTNADMKTKLNEIKLKAADMNRTDVIGLQKKLSKLQKQNKLLKSLQKV